MCRRSDRDIVGRLLAICSKCEMIPGTSQVVPLGRGGSADETAFLNRDRGQRIAGRLRRFTVPREHGGAQRKPRGSMFGVPNGEPGLWRCGDYQSLCPGVCRIGAMGTVRTGAAGPAGSIRRCLGFAIFSFEVEVVSKSRFGSGSV